MTEMDFRNYVSNHIQGFSSINFMHLEETIGYLQQMQNSRSILWTAGNGGSASTASHLSNDFSKGLDPNGVTNIRTICLTDSVPTLTAWANDDAYSNAVAQEIATLADSKDALFAISGSGNSHNIINAVKTAKLKGMKTISLTGFGGGEVATQSDININVEVNDMQVVEDMHLIICHWMMRRLKSLK
jgi:D-sedoheptulose 7-phosphate isomerase